MFNKNIKLALVIAISAAIGACNQEEKTYEGTPSVVRLTRSFSGTTPQMQQHIADIIKDANDLNYPAAMNKLAVLAATKKITQQQKIAVELMVKQLRYDMEEKIFEEQGHPK